MLTNGEEMKNGAPQVIGKAAQSGARTRTANP